MNIGYMRVSTGEQNPDLQRDALTKAGCEKLFSDVASGATVDRPGLNEAIEFARSGDVIVVYRLDRLGRSLAHLIATVKQLEDRGIGFKSLSETIDTTSSAGRLIFSIFGALAEFERNLIRERTNAGLAAARQRGRVGGRPRSMSTDKLAAAKKLLAGGTPPKDVAAMLGLSIGTLYRWLPASKRVA
jgi:DNA invertase Pin-like site-specific DNA recombinase